MTYKIQFTKEAFKDIKKLTPKLKKKAKDILTNQIAEEPESGKRLTRDLTGFYSVRLSYQDRIVYSINKKKKLVTVHRARTHYGE